MSGAHSAATTGEKIVVLQTQMDDAAKSINELKIAQDLGFKDLSAKLDGIPYSISALDARLTTLEKKNSRSWISNTLSAVLGVILTGLVSLIVFLVAGKN